MINHKILEIITAKYYGTLHGEICISPLSSQLIFIMTIYCWIYNNWIYKNDVLKRSHAVTIFILAKYKSRLYLFLAMSRIFVRIEALHNNVFKMYRWIIFTIFSFILLLHNKKIIYQSHCKSISKMNSLQTKMKYSWILFLFLFNELL